MGKQRFKVWFSTGADFLPVRAWSWTQARSIGKQHTGSVVETVVAESDGADFDNVSEDDFVDAEDYGFEPPKTSKYFGRE